MVINQIPAPNISFKDNKMTNILNNLGFEFSQIHGSSNGYKTK